VHRRGSAAVLVPLAGGGARLVPVSVGRLPTADGSLTASENAPTLLTGWAASPPLGATSPGFFPTLPSRGAPTAGRYDGLYAGDWYVAATRRPNGMKG